MAKKKRRKKEPECTTPNCLMHKFWPAVEPAFGKDAVFYVEEATGEVVIYTGLRALPDLELVPCDKAKWFKVKCDCGSTGIAREDLLHQGKTSGCSNCVASAAQLRRN